MRQGRYERELRNLEWEPESIQRHLVEIKTRGRKVRTCEKMLRKAKGCFEFARRACLDLPKSWRSYKAHGKNRDLYANPKVQRINDAYKKLSMTGDSLRYAIQCYKNRYAVKKELKARLQILPDLIESAKQLAEIEAKKKALRMAKAKPEKDWKSKWREVAPGLVVPFNTLKAYVKTFDDPIPVNKETVSIHNDIFTLRPVSNRNIYLKLPCYTWEQAERMRA
jgi:hypothetical protein